MISHVIAASNAGRSRSAIRGSLGGTLRAQKVATEHFVQALLTEKKSAKVQHLTKALSSCLKRVEYTIVPYAS